MIGKEIKRMRNEKGISQKGLSEMVFCNQNTISQYESQKRIINADMLKDITEALDYDIKFIKKDESEKVSTIKTFNHLELIKEMNSKIFNLTGIDMDFEFELSFDGNLDLYVNHKFSISDVKRLIELEWLNSSILEDFIEDDNCSPFDLDDELCLSHNLFTFMLEKTFGYGSKVVGVYDLGEYIELNISVPI